MEGGREGKWLDSTADEYITPLPLGAEVRSRTRLKKHIARNTWILKVSEIMSYNCSRARSIC